MDIFNETFIKHKRLMLEAVAPNSSDWLYHATSQKDVESIKQNGPDLGRSGQNFSGAGAGQGSGFYFYKDLKRATGHATDNRMDRILVFNEPIDNNTFDIDYEGEFGLAAKFLLDNIEFISSNKDKLGIARIAKLGDSTNLLVIDGSSRRGISLNKGPDDDVSVGSANAISSIFRCLEKLDGAWFDRFENKFLRVATIIKYNGTNKIYPVRVEDLSGNVLWKK